MPTTPEPPLRVTLIPNERGKHTVIISSFNEPPVYPARRVVLVSPQFRRMMNFAVPAAVLLWIGMIAALVHWLS